MSYSFLAPRCPHCQNEVRLLAPEWQAQRQSKTKSCPNCGKAVEPKFKPKTYATWFALFAGASYLLGRLLGLEVGAVLGVVPLSVEPRRVTAPMG
jgi:endogenous inhibitor of DNA gyrase (YacG/DUF329 family)